MRPLWKRFIRMPCETSQCCGREKLHFFSTAKYLYSPFNKRQILWIPMSSTGLGVFSIVRQNRNELFNIFLSSTLAYIGRTSQSLKGHASIELKLLIIITSYIQNYINTCIVGITYFVERSIYLIEEHWLLIITGVQSSGIIIYCLLRQCCAVLQFRTIRISTVAINN